MSSGLCSSFLFLILIGIFLKVQAVQDYDLTDKSKLPSILDVLMSAEKIDTLRNKNTRRLNDLLENSIVKMYVTNSTNRQGIPDDIKLQLDKIKRFYDFEEKRKKSKNILLSVDLYVQTIAQEELIEAFCELHLPTVQAQSTSQQSPDQQRLKNLKLENEFYLKELYASPIIKNLPLTPQQLQDDINPIIKRITKCQGNIQSNVDVKDVKKNIELQKTLRGYLLEATSYLYLLKLNCGVDYVGLIPEEPSVRQACVLLKTPQPPAQVKSRSERIWDGFETSSGNSPAENEIKQAKLCSIQ